MKRKSKECQNRVGTGTKIGTRKSGKKANEIKRLEELLLLLFQIPAFFRGRLPADCHFFCLFFKHLLIDPLDQKTRQKATLHIFAGILEFWNFSDKNLMKSSTYAVPIFGTA